MGWDMIMCNFNNISFCLGEEVGEGRLGNLDSMVRIIGKFRLGQTSGGHLVQCPA